MSANKELSIDVLREKVVLLSDLKNHVPYKPGYNTVLVWAKVGKKNRRTRRIHRLQTVRLPNGLATSLEAYQRFIQELNNDDSGKSGNRRGHKQG